MHRRLVCWTLSPQPWINVDDEIVLQYCLPAAIPPSGPHLSPPLVPSYGVFISGNRSAGISAELRRWNLARNLPTDSSSLPQFPGTQAILMANGHRCPALNNA